MKYDFDKLLPDELEKIKSIINELLISLGKDRLTNARYQIRDRIVKCPKCDSNIIVKNGHKNGTQRYLCNSCLKYFSITTNTILSYSKISYNQLITLLGCLLDNKPNNETALLLKMSGRETYNLRIKIMSVLESLDRDIVLKGLIQMDEMYLRISFKGKKKEKMPRKSHRNGFEDRTSGISKHQVCILFAIDSYDNIIIKVVGNGPLTTKMIEDNFNNKIEKGSIVVTDSKSSYIEFAKKNDLILKQIPADKFTLEDKYNLAEVNELMSEFEIMFQECRGLSTRHLQQYLYFFKYKKLLKYTIEYLKINEEFYKKSISENSKIKNNDICKVPLPIDISDLYNGNFK